MKTIHDWRHRVRQRLEACELPRAMHEDVIAELAAHLEETYDAAVLRGLNEAAAIEVALQEVEDWRALAQNISNAKSQEGRMNYRTKSLWLPGLSSLAAANLLALTLTRISLEPQFLIRLNSGLARSFYWGWLIAQLAVGGLGAFLSRRAGGTRIARIIAAAFPAFVMFGLCGIGIPVSSFCEHNSFVFHHPLRLAFGILVWAIAPGIAALLGAAPFLEESKLREA